MKKNSVVVAENRRISAFAHLLRGAYKAIGAKRAFGLPEKEYYRNPKKHIESFLRGIPLFAAVAALTALIVTVL